MGKGVRSEVLQKLKEEPGRNFSFGLHRKIRRCILLGDHPANEFWNKRGAVPIVVSLASGASRVAGPGWGQGRKAR